MIRKAQIRSVLAHELVISKKELTEVLNHAIAVPTSPLSDADEKRDKIPPGAEITTSANQVFIRWVVDKPGVSDVEFSGEDRPEPPDPLDE